VMMLSSQLKQVVATVQVCSIGRTLLPAPRCMCTQAAAILTTTEQSESL
jgi:hypothetical protein